MQKDLADIKLNHSYHKSVFFCQNQVIEWIENDMEIGDSTTYQFSMAHGVSFFMVSQAPFESVKQFGLNRISDDSIKTDITFLYDISYPLYRTLLAEYRTCLNDLVKLKGMYFENWSWREINMKPLDPSSLKSDREYLARLKHLRGLNDQLVMANSVMENSLILTIEKIAKFLL
jgi:hypothetical protein